MTTTADVSRDKFLELAARSRLIDAEPLRKAATRLPGAPARGVADALVRTGDLTHFQAEKLLRGHWQGLALGPYHILAPLGRGGMGTVYLARDTRLAEELGDEVLVALKVLPPKVARAEPRMLARFRREIELGQCVNHPQVVRTLTGGEADGVHFLAMEYVPGKTVGQIVVSDGRLSVGDAARWFADVAAGLAGVHDSGLVHRDVKPGNVILTQDGRAKLLDLGFAYRPGEPLPDDPTIVGGAGYIVGTMNFISPEQARDATAARPASDLYSLGCSIYYALTGTPPFPGGTAKDKIRRQLTMKPTPIADLNPEVPAEFVRIVERLMAKNPGDRPPTGTAARELLLPFAVPPKRLARLTPHTAIEAVDSPEAHPELWTDDSVEITDRPGPDASDVLSLSGTAETGRSSWLLGCGIMTVLVVLAALYAQLRRL
jgi:serine/threonine protein kinase